ncbi:MAG: hypothetical protein COT15_00030 [Candidatus Diapherotrites archaeon CG08_land_8_20_14_0_20_34_12]|nr:MAG: hypothetical protein COT15_00030 [Candidatus Diapherotrites archaeon CG08_land_8_20_14_0_20_34_12]
MIGTVLLVSESPVWDVLRPLIQFSTEYSFYIKLIVIILSLILLAVAAKAYLMHKSNRFLLLIGVFGLFSIKWIIKLIDVFYSPGYFFSDPVETVFDLVTFAMLFLALFKKEK